jgi:hypothetical protein
MKIKEIIDKKKENVSNIKNTLKEKETKQKLENNITNKNNNPAKKKRKNKKKKTKIKKEKKNSIYNGSIVINSLSLSKIKKNDNTIKYTDRSEKNFIIPNKEKPLYYTDYELNNFEYSYAIENDKRTYFEYYISLIRTKHLLIFTFWPIKDYNSVIIKFCLFFFSFSLYFTINAFFFNDDTMHKIYEDHGTFNFVYQIPNIVYSSIISAVISTIIKTLSLTQKNIIKIKEIKTYEESLKEMNELIKCLKIKFIIYFTLSFLLLIFFWYYLGTFCAVYKNTQLYLIKDVLISFTLSLIYPFGYYLFPGILRIPSLRNKKKDKEFIYKISLLLQSI